MEAKAAQGKNQGEKDTGANVKKESSPTKNAEDGNKREGGRGGFNNRGGRGRGGRGGNAQNRGRGGRGGGHGRDGRDHDGQRGNQMGFRGGQSDMMDGRMSMYDEMQMMMEPREKRKFTGRCRLFVGNVTQDMTEEDFKEMFTPYGECGEIFLNGSKGFGFVRLVRMKLNSFFLESVRRSGPKSIEPLIQ